MTEIASPKPQKPLRLLLLNLAILLMVTLSFWQFGKGAYIYAKAYLAQRLLEHAWQESLAGHTQVKPWPWADTYPVARMRVPALGIDQIVLAGATGRTLAFGPGHTSASYLPGKGTTIISGHRDTHFSFLQKLEPHDQIFIETPDGNEQVFTVTEMTVTDVQTYKLLLSPAENKLILVTCFPFNVVAATGSLRYVVTAKLEYFAAK